MFFPWLFQNLGYSWTGCSPRGARRPLMTLTPGQTSHLPQPLPEFWGQNWGSLSRLPHYNEALVLASFLKLPEPLFVSWENGDILVPTFPQPLSPALALLPPALAPWIQQEDIKTAPVACLIHGDCSIASSGPTSPEGSPGSLATKGPWGSQASAPGRVESIAMTQLGE